MTAWDKDVWDELQDFDCLKRERDIIFALKP